MLTRLAKSRVVIFNTDEAIANLRLLECVKYYLVRVVKSPPDFSNVLTATFSCH